MITKKRLKKIIISIVVFILTLTLFTNRVDASMIDISQSYISQIIGQYYWDNARTQSDNTRTLEDFVNEASNNISSFAQSHRRAVRIPVQSESQCSGHCRLLLQQSNRRR